MSSFSPIEVGERPPPTRRWFEALVDASLRPLFGDDLFISYSRKNQTYVLNLANELVERGFSPYVDQFESQLGRELPASLRGALRRASLLLVVATSEATRSEYVAQEISAYLLTGRAVSVIEIDNALSAAPWAALVAGPAPITESLEALHGGHPTPDVVARLVASLRFIRAKTRIRALGVGALTLILAAGAVSVFFGHRVRDAVGARQQAEARAHVSNQLAENAQGRLQSATDKIAAADQTLAAKQDQLTLKETELASRTQQVDALDQKVRQLDQLATQRHQLNLAQKLVALAEQENKWSTLGLLQAAESLSVTPTVEGDRLLRSQLATLAPRAAAIDDGTGERGAVFAPDGSAFFANSRGDLTVVDFRGERVATDASPGAAAHGIFGNATADTVATLGSQGTLAFWRWDGQRLVREAPSTPPSAEKALSVNFVPRTPYMILRREREADVWSAKERTFERTVQGAIDITVTSTGRIGYLDYHRKLWTGTLTSSSDKLLGQMTKWSNGVTLSPDGRWLFVVDLDFKAFDLESGKAVSVPISSQNVECESVAFSPDGKHVALATLNSTDILETGTWRKVLNIPGAARAATFSNDGSLIALAWRDVAKVFRVGGSASGSEPPVSWASSTNGVIAELSFAGRDKYLLGIVQTSSGAVGNAWDLTAASRQRNIKGAVTSLLACGRDRIGYLAEGQGILWDTKRNSEVRRDPATQFARTPDGKRFAVENEGDLRIWDARTLRLITQRNEAAKGHIRCGALGQCVALTLEPGNDRAVVARLDTGAILGSKRWPSHVMELVGWDVSPDGHWLARSSSEGSVLVWDLRSGVKIIDERVADGGIFGIDALAFSSSSDRFAAATSEGRVFVWSLSAGVTKLTTLFPESGMTMARSIAFSGDGARLLEIGDFTFTLFDIARSLPIVSPLAADGVKVTDAVLTQQDDAVMLATTDDEDKQAAIEEFPLTNERMLADTCLRLHRNMTVNEWAHSMGYAPYRKTCGSLASERDDVPP